MLRNPGLRKSVEQPVLDLNFAASQIGSNAAPDARIDFSRGSNAYFVDSDGLVKKSPHNLLTKSEDITAWTSFNTTVSANAAESPTGELTADKSIADSGQTTHVVRRDIPGLDDSVDVAVSVYLKQAGFTSVAIQFYDKNVTFHSSGNFDLTDGSRISNATSGTQSSIEHVGNDWYRITFTGIDAGSGSQNPSVRIGASGTGDGSKGFLVWGAQVSQHSTLPVDNPYVKTEGSAVYAARLDHDPTWFMSAAQEQNLLLYSEVLTDATYWSATRITGVSNTTDTTAPDGTNTAERFLENAVTNTHFFQNDLDESAFITEGKSYTYSAYVKRVAGSNDRNINIELFTTNQAFSPYSVASFDLDAVSSTASTGSPDGHSITDEGNGWFRISITEVANKTTRPAIALVFTEGTTRIYAGDTSKGFYVWGIQLEVGTNPGTYYRTEGAPYYGPGATPKGLLIEEARTNVAPNSHEFTANAGVTRSASNHFAPDGNIDGDEFTIDSTSGVSHQIGMNGLIGGAVTIGTVHTVSFFAKLLNGTPNIGVRGFGKGGQNQHPIFNLSNGTVANVGSAWESGTKIEDFGNGWFRCSCVVNPSNQFAPIIHMLESGDTIGSLVFTGNGTDKIALWGGQLEVGSFVTSHIPTTGSTATRNADVATMGPTTGGTELVTNGTFDTATDWDVPGGGSGTVSITGGVLDYSSVSQFNSTRQDITSKLTVGRRYRMSMDVVSYTAGSVDMRYQVDGAIVENIGNKSATGTYTLDFTCTDTSVENKVNIQSRTSGANTFQIDNISVRELYPFEQYNPSEGTLYSLSSCIGNDTHTVLSVHADSFDNYFSHTYRFGNSLRNFSKGGGSTELQTAEAVTLSNRNEIATTYDGTSMDMSANGSDETTGTLGADIVGIHEIAFGLRYTANQYSGHIERVQYFPRALPKVTLQSLTSD